MRARADAHLDRVVRLLSSPATHGDQGVSREESFKLVSGWIVHCAFIAGTEYGLSNGGGWKHAEGLILMGIGLQAFCHRV